MTKREKQRSLTKEFLTWVKEVYPKAEFDDSEGYGYTDISIDGDFNGDNVISFRRHHNQVDTYNWAADHIKEAEVIMEKKLDELKDKYQLFYGRSN